MHVKVFRKLTNIVELKDTDQVVMAPLKKAPDGGCLEGGLCLLALQEWEDAESWAAAVHNWNDLPLAVLLSGQDSLLDFQHLPVDIKKKVSFASRQSPRDLVHTAGILASVNH